MTNAARGEFNYPIGTSGSLDFALSLKASQALENMSEDGTKDVGTMVAILADMTVGTANEMDAEEMASQPLTLVDFKKIVAGATEAANDALPDDRDVGNAPNRAQRRASKATPKGKAKPRKKKKT